MKKAFTMVELIFVLVVGTILASIAMSMFDNRSNDLTVATNQLMSHLRYTQHLAIIDDKYNPNDNMWWKARWQIYFEKSAASNNKWAYSVFSDSIGTSGYTGKPDKREVAKNPADNSRYITGGSSGTGHYHYDDNEATQECCLGCEYGIDDIKFENFNRVGVGGKPATRLAFDEIGRPIIGDISKQDDLPYKKNRYLSKVAKITLIHESGEKASICIEPESGYVHRCD